MARPDLATQTRAVLVRMVEPMRTVPGRVAVVGGGLGATITVHALSGETLIAWAATPIVLLAGIAGGVRLALAAALVAALGHAALDALDGAGPIEALGLVIRTLVLVLVGLVGSTGASLDRQREAAIERSVTEDPVTGLLNVRAFYDLLEELRAGGEPYAILLADLRGMRALNDRYGHPTGTEAMRVLAHVLRRSAGRDIAASRLGSDEIAVVLKGDERDRFRAIVERAVERLHDELVTLPDSERFEVHASYGLARFPEDADDTVGVLRAADRAKERAKSAGMDRVGTAEGDVV
jgi:diguanylate cyclase (GGDEF)-like protein